MHIGNQLKVIAERTMFLSTAQGSDETETDVFARLREVARYCKFETLKTLPDLEAELLRKRFLARLKSKEDPSFQTHYKSTGIYQWKSYYEHSNIDLSQ